MKPIDVKLGQDIEDKLSAFEQHHSMPGIELRETRDCFIEQIIDSVRRIRYISLIKEKNIGRCFADPNNEIFDPLKAASVNKKEGNIDEAFWLIFLATHFGKNKTSNWELVRNIYRGEDANSHWTWQRTATNPGLFRDWLHNNNSRLKQTGKFGNHRKFESLNASKNNGTGETIQNYIDWVGPNHSHNFLISKIRGKETNPRRLFNLLYNSMKSIKRFGRTARFDYLTMIGKFGLSNIEPGSTFMEGASGPYIGANLLFNNSSNINMPRAELDYLLIKLEAQLGLYFGMQVLEDALCNWQKSPDRYKHFIG